MYTYVDEFLEICSTFKFQNFFDESVRLKLFPFSLKDQARVWLNHLKPNSITTWRDLNFKFVSKFYSMSRTNQYRLKISTFKQKERNFMSHGKGLRISKSSVHTHNFKKWWLVQYFFNGLTDLNRNLVEFMSGGSFMGKSTPKTYALFERLAENSQQ